MTHPENSGKARRQLDDATGALIVVRHYFDVGWRRMCDATPGQPGAQRLDGVRGAQSVKDDRDVPMPALSDPDWRGGGGWGDDTGRGRGPPPDPQDLEGRGGVAAAVRPAPDPLSEPLRGADHRRGRPGLPLLCAPPVGCW